ncbi:DNA2/NAM7 family helicase [Holosporaceae bacterium 'Namur']|nr:DNA2/NAM7 family helicase [Holosporaceae bacterium 'Namur']
MGSNTIGWLLIDEAGQSLPQIASGALFRAKRAMIVGDPLQIEPIRPVPKVISIMLRDYFGVSDDWNPLNQSVQTLADRANPIGTKLSLGENNCWIGAPLRVHRRCNDPMFTLSNSIIYNDLMIYGSNNKPMPVDRKLSDSVWAHVTSNGKIKDNWSKEEGEVALNFLRHIKQLRDINCNLKSTFVISPFKSIKTGLSSLIKDNHADKELFRNKAVFERWIEFNVGTTHTFQGKEAEIVIFILGGNCEKSNLNWVAETPNILNVALTRAKRAIYIIGDFHIWSNMNYFNQLNLNLCIKPYHEKLLPYKKGGESP